MDKLIIVIALINFDNRIVNHVLDPNIVYYCGSGWERRRGCLEVVLSYSYDARS